MHKICDGIIENTNFDEKGALDITCGEHSNDISDILILIVLCINIIVAPSITSISRCIAIKVCNCPPLALKCI